MGSDRQTVDTSRSSPAAVSQELATLGTTISGIRRDAADNDDLHPNRSLGTSK